MDSEIFRSIESVLLTQKEFIGVLIILGYVTLAAVVIGIVKYLVGIMLSVLKFALVVGVILALVAAFVPTEYFHNAKRDLQLLLRNYFGF